MRITKDNIEACDLMPSDMRREAKAALESASEIAVYYVESVLPGREKTHYLYFPLAGRGAVCTNGPSEWTDCNSLEDLANRWDNYDEMWSN